MFLNNLYTISAVKTADHSFSADIVLDAAHEIYRGHFPGAPVTPGVVQLQIVKELLEQHLGRNLRLKTMRVCKFMQIINPEETPEIRIDIKFTEGALIDVTASGSFQDITYFKTQISYI